MNQITDHQDDSLCFQRSNEVTLEVRFVEEHYLTTATCVINSGEATTPSDLYHAAGRALQDRYNSFIHDQSRASNFEPLFYLEQHSYLGSSWTTAKWRTPHEYGQWYGRNVLHGQKLVPRIEIHFDHDAACHGSPCCLTRRDYLRLEDRDTGDSGMDNKWEPGTSDFFAGRPVTFCTPETERWTEEEQEEFMEELIAAMEKDGEEEDDEEDDDVVTGHGVISGLPSSQISGVMEDSTIGHSHLGQASGQQFTLAFRGRPH